MIGNTFGVQHSAGVCSSVGFHIPNAGLFVASDGALLFDVWKSYVITIKKGFAARINIDFTLSDF